MASNNKSSADSSTTLRDATRQPRQVSSRNSNVSDLTTDDEKQPTAKKIPPIKAPVGLAKGPDLKNCKSKVGSLNNIKHAPTSSGVTIQSQKLKWEAKSKVGSLENKAHKPGGGNRKVETQKLEWKTTSKVQSLQNVKHKPGGGNVRIFNETYLNKASSNRKQENDVSSNDNTSDSGLKSPLQEGKEDTSTGSGTLGEDLQNLKI